jgi:hypothetical protein
MPSDHIGVCFKRAGVCFNSTIEYNTPVMNSVTALMTSHNIVGFNNRRRGLQFSVKKKEHLTHALITTNSPILSGKSPSPSSSYAYMTRAYLTFAFGLRAAGRFGNFGCTLTAAT